MKRSNLIALFGMLGCCLAACGGGGGTTSVAGSTALVAPADVGVSANAPEVEYSAGIVTIAGTGFGTKAVVAPTYFNNMEADIIGAMPSGMITNTTTWGTTQANVARGTKSLEWNYYGDIDHKEDFKRNAVDVGATDRIYFSFWLYIDRSQSTITDTWQWKPWLITSSSRFYYDLPTGYPSDNLPYSSYAYNSTAAFTSCWTTGTAGAFFNNSGLLYYYDNLVDFVNKPGGTGAGTSDRYVWNEWQRIEGYAQRSSLGGASDGIWRNTRIGYGDLFNITNAITHLTGNDEWRYVVLSNATASVVPTVPGEYLDFRVYMDDIYIDTTQARVEVGNSPDFNSCTHREIQYPISWSDTEVQIDFRKGSFNSGDTVYFFVINGEGAVVHTSAGFRVP